MEQHVKTKRPRGRHSTARPTAARSPSPATLVPRGLQIRSYGVIVVLLALTLALSSLIFAPLDQWYLAYVCMVPWLIVIGGCESANRVYATSWLLGFAFFLINMWWMEAPTGMGYIALSAYLACYYPLVACPVRHAVRRRRWPLALAFPMIWVGAEFLRGLLLSGFPWFFLAHSHYKVLTMIQISDLVGAYGLSFVLAMVNGAVADVVFARYGYPDSKGVPCRRRLGPFSAVVAGLFVLATLGYGQFQLHRDTIRPGPRIALIQRDYPNYTDSGLAEAQPGPRQKRAAYFQLMKEAERQRPDLYLLPETVWGYMFLNQDFRELDPGQIRDPWWATAQRWSRESFTLLQDWSTRTGAAIVVGSASATLTPLDLRTDRILYNSAYCFTPDGREPQRHDKIHPVLFGETVPFRYGRLRFLYRWLNSLSPFGTEGFEYSLTAGDDVRVFEFQPRGEPGQTYHFGVPICYEDVMPYVCRRFTVDEKGNKRIDFLLNISNDGWFLHRNELQQHFAICVFRAVENRVGIARTVNTGVSGFIDPDGRAHNQIGVAQVGYEVDRVATDSRVTFYAKFGDWFALLCALACVPLYVDYVIVRAVSSRRKRPARLR